MEQHINETPHVSLNTNQLFVVTPLSKYFALILFIILPFVGFWLGTIYAGLYYQQKITTDTHSLQSVVSRSEVSKKIDIAPTYTSKDGVFSIAYPANQVIQPIPDKQVSMMGETATATYSADSMEIPNLFIVSKVSYENLSGKDMTRDGGGTIYDYESCCSGTGYNFDSNKKVWSAITFQLEGQSKPKLLNNTGICSLAAVIGDKTFYRIKQGDEGVVPDFHYFFMTDQGYALQFTSKFDLDPAYYSNYDPASKPDPKYQTEAAQVLASITLNTPVKELEVTCN